MLGYLFAFLGVVVLIAVAVMLSGGAGRRQGVGDSARLRPDERAGTSRSEPSAEEPNPARGIGANLPRPTA